MQTFKYLKLVGLLGLLAAAIAGSAFGQTTDFTYQGKLNDGGVAANGTYEFQIKLFDSPTVGTGTQIGGIVQTVNATVTNGIFTIPLDFGEGAFGIGADRFLEIAVRRTAGDPYVTLSPRQRLTSAPYAIKSRSADIAATAGNASQLDGIPASQYVQTTDSRMTDSRVPLPNSPNYVQNTTVQQAASNFNISGEGKANVFSAATQFNIGASRVLGTAGSFNLFVGAGAGAANSGSFNTFIGAEAGRDNTTGSENTFAGRGAGRANTTAFGNSFFGRSAGIGTTTGEQNSFFGQEAGLSNTTARYNAFFGALSGRSNTTGEGNSFFGTSAGLLNSTGTLNSFFGIDAGRANTTGTFNTFIGAAAGVDNTAGQENTFVGRAAGFNNTIASGNSFFGRSAGLNNTEGINNSFFGISSGAGNVLGDNVTLLGANTNVAVDNLAFATAIGAGAVVGTSNTILLGRTNGADKVKVPGLGTAGATLLCRNGDLEIATCLGGFAEDLKAVTEISGIVRQQEARLNAQDEMIRQQRLLIESLKQLVCAQNPSTEVCREQK